MYQTSDILTVNNGKDVLQVHDPVTDTTIPIIATHATMDRLLDLGESVCRRLGMQAPPKDHTRTIDTMKQHRPESYTGSVPHWWIAVSVEEEIMNGKKRYYMVHLDVCGAAYDRKALVQAPSGRSETLISLQTFETPEYEMIPNSDDNLQHKLVMKAFTSKRTDNSSLRGGNTRIALQPKSIRHFRCYHNDDTSSIEVTPLATYLERNQFSDDDSTKISEIVFSIQQNVIMQLPVGSEVTVCNIKSKPALNGRTGVVYESKLEVGNDRVPLMIKGRKTPLSLKTTCIHLPNIKKRQYQTLDEKVSEYNKSLDDCEEYTQAKNQEYTQNQKSQMNKAMNDPDVVKALSVIQAGQAAFSSFGDSAYKRGIGKFLKPPLDALLPKSLIENLRCGYELSNHPNANDAIKLINLMKAGKQRLLQDHPDALEADGGVRVSSDDPLHRIQKSVIQRIRSDDGLYFVFERLDELGLYTNPAK
mmetsp:Transcript_16494/g.24154  ORF Transcript_16494/g.24154 Transcript_16494/m.24154 type:complete len:474 (+) Transcript_16494:242-1663(+)